MIDANRIEPKKMRQRVLLRQIERLGRSLERLQQTNQKFSWLRLILFLGTVVACFVGFFVFGPGPFAAFFILGAIAFGVVVYLHRKITDQIAHLSGLCQIKSAQVARMNVDWANIPPAVSAPSLHPQEADFDLVGDHSLHRLISTAVSHEGKQRLRKWLAASIPNPEEITRRQHLVQELSQLFIFRNRLTLSAIIAEEEKPKEKFDHLEKWLKKPPKDEISGRWLIMLTLLSVTTLILFGLNLLGLVPAFWQISLVLYVGLTFAKSKVVNATFYDAANLQESLQQLLAVFQHLERFSYRNKPHLETLCRPFRSDTERPSSYLTRIARVVNATGMRGNPLIWLILNIVPWDCYFAYQLQRHKRALAARLPAWMDIWFELEALNSFANLAYLNPHYTFPTLHETTGMRRTEGAKGDDTAPPIFQATSLGHPLLPDGEKVCNTFVLNQLGDLLLITGSNMAGKSTFLRTVGLNLILAYAGGPVDAISLQTLPFRLFSCIRITDSIADGTSYFYAEVKRLKTLLTELSHPSGYPLFFFIDEIFRGTNNRERLIGSRAYVQALSGQWGIGLISTHDLELTQLADEQPSIRNVHFREHLSDGRMIFDYTLHDGPCTTTNALKIMQQEGLPI